MGKWGWLGLGAYVALWDMYAPETLTHAFKTAPRPLTVLFWGVTTLHLFGLLPPSTDPFYRLAHLRH